MTFGIMDFYKEPSDGEWEKTSAGTRASLNIIERQHHSILVLSDLEESERVGRVCRAQKYQLVRRPNDTGLNVNHCGADPIKDTKEVSDTMHDCTVCGAEHSCRAELKLHMEDHKGSQGYKIRRGLPGTKKNHGAEKEVQTSSDLKSTQLANQETRFSSRKKYMCNLCGAEYVNRARLITHKRIHTGETPYVCKLCGKGFRRSDWLAKHMNTHKDKSQASPDHMCKQHVCDYCGKRYKQKSSLQAHLHVHTKKPRARPSQCAICKKHFYDRSSLEKHLMCHSDDRPYTCSECGYGFKRLGTLNKHKHIHTGEKPYSCGACGKSLSYKYSMSMHMKTCRRLRDRT
ncbi:zinc finger protein 260-like [Silurus meridionalis]|uniref:zinc finger protein 260-like n=1 Tax=Silurus meridionalis TaxID=175797 RepID=UPI001EEB89B3|nr:zinc finger protein 260-like [Silurus meridionalis]